jgi:hypothetical protein
MKTLRNLAKFLQISLIILLLTLLTTRSAYARGGCFGSGTTILTPNGYKYILGENNALLFISSIKYVNKSLTVYNLLSVTPNHNFYASDVLVHNKDFSFSFGGSSRGINGSHGGARGAPLIINKKTLPSLIFAIMVILSVLLSVAFRTEICNYFRFFGQRFTDDLGLIQFIKTINLKITNFYSNRYSKDNEIWEIIPAQPELDEQAYQDLLSRSDLIDRVSRLFIQYQKDWTMKNFVEMTEYVVEPFYTEQLDICRSGFGENSDIVYQPELLEIVPLVCKRAEDRYIFRVQINAKMVNFKLSPQGFVLSGKNDSRSFTEYWDIEVDLNKKCYLTNISQIDPGAIPLS